MRRKALGKKGRELRAMDEGSLRRLPAVEKALAEARDQVEGYRAALVRQRCLRPLLGEHGDTARPRCYAVVAVGLERMLGEEVIAAGD